METGANRRRHRISVVGVIGEILLTLGVVALLYVGWQLWIGDLILGAQGNAVGHARLEEWAASSATDPPSPSPSEGVPTSDPPVMAPAPDTEVFAVMQIPRFGSDYAIDVAGGVTRGGTLDRTRIGHYLDTEMPGEIGNVALAAHRTTFGAPFARIADLRVGDPLVITTQDGWYVYRFRTLEYVVPTAGEVLADVPQHPELPADGRYITLTSCSPKFSQAERIVAYGVFDSFTPRSAGPPAALSEPGA